MEQDKDKITFKEDYHSSNGHGQLSYKQYYINDKKVSYEQWIKYNRNIKLNSIWDKIK